MSEGCERHEAIRAMLLYTMVQTTANGDRWPTLEDCPFNDVLLAGVRLPGTSIDVHAHFSTTAYFALLEEFGFLETHRALHEATPTKADDHV